MEQQADAGYRGRGVYRRMLSVYRGEKKAYTGMLSIGREKSMGECLSVEGELREACVLIQAIELHSFSETLRG